MLIGRVTGFEIGQNQDGDEDVLLLQVEMTESDDVQTVELFNPGGRDYNPTTNSQVIVLPISDALQIAVAVSDGITPESEPGEVEIYSADSYGGSKKAKIKWLVDGTLKLNEGVKAAARVNDSIRIDATTDPAFFTWLGTVGSFIGTPPPTTITGKIVSGSATVKIGD